MIENKVRQILNDPETNGNPDLEMDLEVFEFEGCYHENVSPKDKHKRRKYKIC